MDSWFKENCNGKVVGRLGGVCDCLTVLDAGSLCPQCESLIPDLEGDHQIICTDNCACFNLYGATRTQGAEGLAYSSTIVVRLTGQPATNLGKV